MQLSKYDVMSKKMNKFSDIVSSFVARYVISITKKKKIETIKIFLDKILCDTHILFEIKKDLLDYSKENKLNINMFNFSKSLSEVSGKNSNIDSATSLSVELFTKSNPFWIALVKFLIISGFSNINPPRYYLIILTVQGLHPKCDQQLLR